MLRLFIDSIETLYKMMPSPSLPVFPSVGTFQLTFLPLLDISLSEATAFALGA